MAAASKLSPRDTKQARELADWVEGLPPGEPIDGFVLMHGKGLARHLLLALKPRSRPRRQSRATGPTKEQRRDERRKRMADRSIRRARRTAGTA